MYSGRTSPRDTASTKKCLTSLAWGPYKDGGNLMEPHAMRQVAPHRKTIRHFHEPGDVHELTFSCWSLRQKARDWRWSSARFYESDGSLVDPLLPLVTPLPAEIWAGP